jgi:hypothetical protein
MLIKEMKMKEQEIQIEINKNKEVINGLEHQLWEIKDNKKNERERFIRDNYKLKDEHKKLLKRMEFKGIWYGDIVSIGADGKRPFGNSDMFDDVARILEWKLPNDYMSDEQREQAEILIDELPYALNEILTNF